MKTQRLLGLVLVLALLLVPGRIADVSALPGEGVSPKIVAAPTGNVIYAASCSQGDVQNAIGAASDGDFVMVPAGSCTWTTPAPNTPAVSISGKGITLQGASVGQTVITDGTGTSWGETLLVVDGAEGKPFRITGFTFTEGNAPVVIHISGDCKNFRIDHCQFASGPFSTGINVNGYTYGVVDHCQFINSRVYVREAIVGDAPWQRPLTLGSANAVYVEDCDYYANILANAVDSTGGARYVFRHNTVVNDYVESHGLHNEGMRGTFSYEVYENTFTAVDTGVVSHVAVSVRGGTGVIFSNTVVNDNPLPTGLYTGFGIMYDNRCCVTSHVWGLCDGSNWVDGNELANGYPCRDQIGRSTDYSASQVHPQAYEPLYAWNNTLDGASAGMRATWCASSQEHIQEGRDFFNGTPRPGYTPYTYPHPLTQDLVLTGLPASESVHLDWDVAAWTYLPLTTTWRVTCYSETVASTVVATDTLPHTTRAYTLTGLTNYQWYTVTLNAMYGTGPVLTDTVRVMPTDIAMYLPLVLR
jgi:hypothetical protein